MPYSLAYCTNEELLVYSDGTRVRGLVGLSGLSGPSGLSGLFG